MEQPPALDARSRRPGRSGRVQTGPNAPSPTNSCRPRPLHPPPVSMSSTVSAIRHTFRKTPRRPVDNRPRRSVRNDGAHVKAPRSERSARWVLPGRRMPEWPPPDPCQAPRTCRDRSLASSPIQPEVRRWECIATSARLAPTCNAGGSTGRIKGRKASRRARLVLELLEDRLAPSVTLTGVPTWLPEGPSPNIGAGDTQGPTPDTTQDVGAVEALAVDPMDSERVLAGSVNGGHSGGRPTTPRRPSPTGPRRRTRCHLCRSGSIAFSPVTDRVIYAEDGQLPARTTGVSISRARAAGPFGVYKSSDGGATWQVLNPSGIFTGLRIERIIPTALNGGQTVFLATTDTNPGPSTTQGGVYRSDDGGATWTRLSGANNGLPDSGVSPTWSRTRFDANQVFAAIPASLSATPGVFRLDMGLAAGAEQHVGECHGQHRPRRPLPLPLRIELSISPAGASQPWSGPRSSTPPVTTR